MVQTLGKLLMWIGAAVGVAAGIWVSVGIERPGLSWIVALGLVKLTIAASIGLIGVGAALLRAGHRARRRQEMEALAAESQAEHIVSPSARVAEGRRRV